MVKLIFIGAHSNDQSPRQPHPTGDLVLPWNGRPSGYILQPGHLWQRSCLPNTHSCSNYDSQPCPCSQPDHLPYRRLDPLRKPHSPYSISHPALIHHRPGHRNRAANTFPVNFSANFNLLQTLYRSVFLPGRYPGLHVCRLFNTG